MNIEEITINGKVVFINPAIPTWVVTNKNGKVIIDLLRLGYTDEEILSSVNEMFAEESLNMVRKFIHKVRDSKLLDKDIPDNPIKHSDYHLGVVQLSISSKCNLNCRYCYATDRKESLNKKLRLSDYIRIIDELISISPNIRFTLTGGEPLLNKDCCSIGKIIHQKGCFVDLLTNGTLISEHNIDLIADSFDEVTISVDGSSKELHESFRGKNTYEKTMQVIELLKIKHVSYRLSMTVNRKNIHDIQSMSEKFGAHLNFAPLFHAGNARTDIEDIAISGMEYYNALFESKGVIPLSYCESSLENSRTNKCYKCAVGDTELSISETGDVYPCQLLHYPEFFIGNVHESSLVDLYKNSPIIEYCRSLTVDNIKGCKDCCVRYICGGSCRARAFHECGDIESASDFCEYEKTAFLNGIVDVYSKNCM